MGLKAVLFDFNGIIIKDESIHLQLIENLLIKENLRPNPREIMQFCLGKSDRFGIQELFARYGRILSEDYLDRLIAYKAKEYQQQLELLDNLPIYEEIFEMIKLFKKKELVLGIVSGALRVEIELVLQKSNLADYFSLIVSQDDIKTSKPDPGGYLLALEKLQLSPKECIAIEDSLAGLSAAKQAGIQVVGVANTYPFHFMQRYANWAYDRLVDLELDRIEEVLQ